VRKVWRSLRTSERLLAAYFLYIIGLASLRPIEADMRLRAITVNISLIAAMVFVAHVDAVLHGRLAVMRDWAPAPLMLLCYREIGWMAVPKSDIALETAWLSWDRALLYDWGLKNLIESLGVTLPLLLEFSYGLVSAIPIFGMALLTATGKRHRMDAFTFTFFVGILGSYVLFPYFPSEPPRTVFPGQDLPLDSPIRSWNWWILSGYGIHTGVFPSAHVSGAFAGAIGLYRCLPEMQWAARLLTILATLIAVATVYGRYHYAVDALAGIVVSGIAWLASRLVHNDL
jgi:membrane-associated phospholipid phosphatase